MKKFLNLISEWSYNFPNDFRQKSAWTRFYQIREKFLDLKDADIMDMFDEIAFYLTSKLRDLTDYEHYLQNINNQLLKKTLDENIKITNTCIIDLCPDFKQLALQLSHIELDRLSHICSEEFLNKKYARDKLDDDNIHNNYKLSIQFISLTINILLYTWPLREVQAFIEF